MKIKKWKNIQKRGNHCLEELIKHQEELNQYHKNCEEIKRIKIELEEQNVDENKNKKHCKE